MNPHGTYSIDRSGNVVRVVAQGPFNDVVLADYGRSLESVIQALPNGPWAILAVLKGESVLVPEAEEKLIEITRWRIQNHMNAIALVVPESSAANLVRAQVERIHSRAGANHAFFTIEEEGLEWLARQGFPNKASDTVVQDVP